MKLNFPAGSSHGKRSAPKPQESWSSQELLVKGDSPSSAPFWGLHGPFRLMLLKPSGFISLFPLTVMFCDISHMVIETSTKHHSQWWVPVGAGKETGN